MALAQSICYSDELPSFSLFAHVKVLDGRVGIVTCHSGLALTTIDVNFWTDADAWMLFPGHDKVESLYVSLIAVHFFSEPSFAFDIIKINFAALTSVVWTTTYEQNSLVRVVGEWVCIDILIRQFTFCLNLHSVSTSYFSKAAHFILTIWDRTDDTILSVTDVYRILHLYHSKYEAHITEWKIMIYIATTYFGHTQFIDTIVKM